MINGLNQTFEKSFPFAKGRHTFQIASQIAQYLCTYVMILGRISEQLSSLTLAEQKIVCGGRGVGILSFDNHIPCWDFALLYPVFKGDSYAKGERITIKTYNKFSLPLRLLIRPSILILTITTTTKNKENKKFFFFNKFNKRRGVYVCLLCHYSYYGWFKTVYWP